MWVEGAPNNLSTHLNTETESENNGWEITYENLTKTLQMKTILLELEGYLLFVIF